MMGSLMKFHYVALVLDEEALLTNSVVKPYYRDDKEKYSHQEIEKAVCN